VVAVAYTVSTMPTVLTRIYINKGKQTQLLFSISIPVADVVTKLILHVTCTHCKVHLPNTLCRTRHTFSVLSANISVWIQNVSPRNQGCRHNVILRNPSGPTTESTLHVPDRWTNSNSKDFHTGGVCNRVEFVPPFAPRILRGALNGNWHCLASIGS